MRPLEGVRIVSVEQFAAGPYGSMLLAGMGAEVIKIENAPAGGDPARYTGPHMLGPADSQYFQTWNLGKKSVALDLKSPEGRRQFERLVKSADAVMNNLRGDQAGKMGLDYATLGKLKPSLACLHITAYGRNNERAARPGYDYMMQAESGIMSLTGEPGGPPSRTGGPSMIDYATGLTAMTGLLAAMLGAARTGKGCDVDVCLHDVALHHLGYAATWFLNTGEVQTQQPRSGHFSVAPVQTVPTADGWIFIMCMTQKFWEAMLGALDRLDLQADPRFTDNPSRFSNREALTGILDAEFQRRPTAYWVELLSPVMPVAPVLDIGQALTTPFVEATGMVQTARHPKGDLRVMSSPIKINGERPRLDAGSSLGADNRAVLGEPAPAEG